MRNGKDEAFLWELKAERGFTPVQLLEKPTLGESVRDLWDAFWALSQSRQMGYTGSQPISMVEIKAYYELTHGGEMDAATSEARLANALCYLPPMPLSECEGQLHLSYQSRVLPRGTDFGAEVKCLSAIKVLAPWQRVRRLITAVQKMDTAFLNYERSKAEQ